ncbi:MAG: heavy metal translocating P-type ATPase, partial [Clostridiales bacterium]|nr:heavy metal translocating P-type ATPase [Clostridiales bacterium]
MIKDDAVKANKQILEYTFEGIDCPTCAIKLQDSFQKLPGVTKVNVNFPAQKITLILDEIENLDDIDKRLIKTLKDIEPEASMNLSSTYANVLNSLGQSKASEASDYSEVSEVSEVSDNSKASDYSKTSDKRAGRSSRSDILSIAKDPRFLFLVSALVFFITSFIINSIFLSVIAAILAGWKVILVAFRNIFKGRVFDENLLMTIAVSGAFIIGEYQEGAAVMIFYQIGDLFQSISVRRSRKSIKDLIDTRPDYANLKENGILKLVHPSEIPVGSLFIARPGEKIALDGVVVSGNSLVDTAALTGEPIPREVGEGSEVLGGFINSTGLLEIKSSKSFGESTASKIISLLENAAVNKAPAENFITRFARYYTPAVVGVALLIAFIPPLLHLLFGINLLKPFGADVSSLSPTFFQLFELWGYRALIFLVISCPCALVISIPLSYFGGIGGASRRGVLVKGGNFLDALNDVGMVVFDKTGTLTKGAFEVINIEAKNGFSDIDVLRYAAIAEIHSSHPIARSIVTAYQKRILEL